MQITPFFSNKHYYYIPTNMNMVNSPLNIQKQKDLRKNVRRGSCMDMGSEREAGFRTLLKLMQQF